MGSASAYPTQPVRILPKTAHSHQIQPQHASYAYPHGSHAPSNHEYAYDAIRGVEGGMRGVGGTIGGGVGMMGIGGGMPGAIGAGIGSGIPGGMGGVQYYNYPNSNNITNEEVNNGELRKRRKIEPPHMNPGIGSGMPHLRQASSAGPYYYRGGDDALGIGTDEREENKHQQTHLPQQQQQQQQQQHMNSNISRRREASGDVKDISCSIISTETEKS